MWFCFQWRVMQEKIWTDGSYKLKPCYFREVFCINSLEEGDWTALEQGIESQTNQVREEKKQSLRKKIFQKPALLSLQPQVVLLGFFGNCQTLHIAFPTTHGHYSSLGKLCVDSTSPGCLWNMRGRRIKTEKKIRKQVESVTVSLLQAQTEEKLQPFLINL